MSTLYSTRLLFSTVDALQILCMECNLSHSIRHYISLIDLVSQPNILELFLDCTTDPHMVGRQNPVPLAAAPIRPMLLQEALDYYNNVVGEDQWQEQTRLVSQVSQIIKQPSMFAGSSTIWNCNQGRELKQVKRRELIDRARLNTQKLLWQ